MMEFPEIQTVTRQAKKELAGKTIIQVFTPTNPSKFTFFNGDVDDYVPLLTGKKILSARGSGMFMDFVMEDDVKLSIGDGVILKYGDAGSKLPEKYQLLLIFNDETFLAFTVAMYGMIYAYRGVFDNMYYRISFEKISPLSEDFSEEHFNNLIEKETKNISVKAMLATEQRIPGLGNGVLQDILFVARVNPKRKIRSLSPEEKSRIFHSIKNTLADMEAKGGRDVETDLYNHKGGYKTILSSKTSKNPCPVCGDTIVKEAYMGGSVYYCPTCQPL